MCTCPYQDANKKFKKDGKKFFVLFFLENKKINDFLKAVRLMEIASGGYEDSPNTNNQ
jgi:hypothetical protein